MTKKTLIITNLITLLAVTIFIIYGYIQAGYAEKNFEAAMTQAAMATEEASQLAAIAEEQAVIATRERNRSLLLQQELEDCRNGR
jgi:hypothetical protein